VNVNPARESSDVKLVDQNGNRILLLASSQRPLLEQFAHEHNQHATLIEQRERLSRAAYQAIIRMEDLPRWLEKNDAPVLGQVVAECLADLSVAIPAELLATIEQEGEA
jgi:hypothetical protein